LPDLALIRMKVSLETKKSTDAFTCTAGYLNSSFVMFAPAMGHLPGSRPRGEGRGALLEMTDAVARKQGRPHAEDCGISLTLSSAWN